MARKGIHRNNNSRQHRSMEEGAPELGDQRLGTHMYVYYAVIRWTEASATNKL